METMSLADCHNLAEKMGVFADHLSLEVRLSALAHKHNAPLHLRFLIGSIDEDDGHKIDGYLDIQRDRKNPDRDGGCVTAFEEVLTDDFLRGLYLEAVDSMNRWDAENPKS